MKTYLLLVAAGIAMTLVSCSAGKQVATTSGNDDVYVAATEASPAPPSSTNTESYQEDISEQPAAREEYSTSEEYVDGEGTTYVTNNYYYGESYASQMDRWYNPYYGFGYYSPVYTGFGYYDPFYYSPGFSISIGFGFGFGYYSPWYYGYYPMYYSPYGYYDPWYNPYYGYGCGPCWGGGYCGGGYYSPYYSYDDYYYGYRGSSAGNTGGGLDGGRIYRETGNAEDSHAGPGSLYGGLNQNSSGRNDAPGVNGSTKNVSKPNSSVTERGLDTDGMNRNNDSKSGSPKQNISTPARDNNSNPRNINDTKPRQMSMEMEQPARQRTVSSATAVSYAALGEQAAMNHTVVSTRSQSAPVNQHSQPDVHRAAQEMAGNTMAGINASSNALQKQVVVKKNPAKPQQGYSKPLASTSSKSVKQADHKRPEVSAPSFNQRNQSSGSNGISRSQPSRPQGGGNSSRSSGSNR